MKKGKGTKLLAGLLCAAIVFSDLGSAGLLSLAAEVETVQETEEQTEIDKNIGSDLQSESSVEGSQMQSTENLEDDTESKSQSQTESVSENVETVETELIETETAAEDISESEIEETETQVVLDADENSISGVIDKDYGHITWVIDSNGKLTVTGVGDFSDPDYNYSDRVPWYKYRGFIKSAKINITDISDVSYMFYECNNMINADLSGLDTSNVSSMWCMFKGCTSLSNLDLHNFNTSSVTNMEDMFYGCSSLSDLDLSNFNTSNVTLMGCMFEDCSSLSSLDLSNFDTSNVISMRKMFYGCSFLSDLDLSNFNTSNVSNMYSMFEGCRWLSSLDLSSFNTSNVINMYGMFYNCSSLVSLNLSSFDTSNVTDMRGMFDGCIYLSSLNLNNFNTSNVTSMCNMFFNCESLTVLDLNNFDTSNVTDMHGMFHGCNSLSSLNLNNFNTSNVTDICDMFYGCYSLLSLDINNFDTANVTNMAYIFQNCSSLSNLDISNFDTSNVTAMNIMFGNCCNLHSLDLHNFNTSNVTSMGGMFDGCSSLTSLDLSSFDTSNVIDMDYMFNGCDLLSKLNISSFNTSNVINMDYMFNGCSSLSNLDVSNFDTSNITNMNNIFSNCNSLSSLDLSNFNISNVYNAQFMFGNCTILSTIYTPHNVRFFSVLPTATSTDKWYRSDGTVVTELPRNLSYSVALGKNYIPKEKEPEEEPDAPTEVIELKNDECTIFVYDTAAKSPIEKAQVIIDDITYPTNAKGIAAFKAANAPTPKEIKVTASGYNDTTTYQSVKNKTSIRIGMNAVSDELQIVSVTGFIGKKSYDFLRTKAVLGYYANPAELTNVTKDTVFLNVKSNKSNVTYELLADNQKLSTSQNGDFTISVLTKGTTKAGDTISTKMPLTDFIKPGQKLSVKATAQDGSSVTTKLKLSSTHNYLTEEIQKQKGSFSFGNNIKAAASEDAPFFGGTEVNMGFDEKFPLEIEIDEDGKIRLAYNKPADIKMEDFGKKYKTWEKKYKKLDKKALWNIGKSGDFDAGMIKVSGKVCGYGEGNIEEIMEGNPTIKMGVMAEIEGKRCYTHYWFIVIPVKIFVEGTATGSSAVEAEITFKNWKVKEFDFTGGGINVKLELEAGAGAGLTKFIYELEVSLTGSFNYATKPARKYQKLWLEGSGKVQRTALYFFEKPLWKSKNYKLTLFQKGTDEGKPLTNAPLADMNAAFSEDGFQLMDRSYLSYSGGYNELGQTVELKAALTDTQSNNTVVKSAVLPSTIPTLVEAEGAKYLFWADDVPSRDDYNRTALMYAKSSDGANWSSPKRLIPETQDNTPDFYHDVFVSNGKIYIVWQDGTRQLTANDSLTDILKSMSIRYAVLDTKNDTVSDGGQLTDSAGGYLYPCATAIGDNVYFAYVHNLLDTGSIDGNNKQKLFLVMPDGTTKEVPLPDKAQLANMDAGIFNKKPSLVCEVDTDGDASTDSDTEIYVCDFESGKLSRITNNQTVDTQPVIANSGNIYWCADNTIIKLSSLEKSPAPIWNTAQLAYPTAFTVATDKAGRDTILWEAVDTDAPDGSVSIFQTSEGSGGEWSDVARFAKTTGTIAAKISVAGSGDSLQAAHTEGIFLEDETSIKDLCVTSKKTTVDIALEYVEFDEEQAAAGNALVLKAGVTNNGNTTIDTLETAAGGKTIATLTGLKLKPYESREIEITGFRVPSDLKKSTQFTLKLTAPDEKNLDNNTADFLLGCPDVYAETSHRLENERTWLDVNLCNSASYEASGKVLVHKGSEDGEVIFSQTYKNLNVENGYAYSVDLGDYEDAYTKYYVEVTSDTEENITGNNTEFVYIGYGTGIEQDEPADDTYEISSIDLNSQSLLLDVGNTAWLSVMDNKGNAINANELLWSSEDKRIAGVDQTGLVTAYRAGTTQITAYYGDLSCTCAVTVTCGDDRHSLTISFDTQGGEELAPITGIAFGSTISLPDNVTRAGYVFEGWYTQPVGGVKIEGGSFTVTETTTLYAHWSLADEDIDTENQGDGLWISGVAKAGYTYTGDAIIPAVTVWDKSTPLVEKTDYTIAYKNNVKVGKATITVTGKGNYSGRETFSFDITPTDIESGVYADSFYVKTNAKKVQKPIPELYYMGSKLRNNKDFTVTYSNTSGIYAQEGEYSVTVTGKNNFTGTKNLTLTAVTQIPKKSTISIAKAAIVGFEKSFTYTGKAYTQTCTLKIQTDGGEKTLVEGADYTVRYANNKKAGTASVTYYGKNGYSGKLKKTYKILPYDIAVDNLKKIVYDKETECFYSKGGAKPKPLITFDGKALREGVDYTLNYKNNKAVNSSGSPCVTIIGKGSFKGKISINFTITPQDLSKMTLVSGDKVYKKKAGNHKITPKLMDLDGKLLSAGKDFDKNSITYAYETDVTLENGVLRKAGDAVENTDILPAGTQIRITLESGSSGNYTGTFTGVCHIVKSDLKSAKVTIPNQTYTGKEITLDKSQITVTLSGTKLKPEDFDIIQYTDNVKKGKAAVTIRGNGNYGGTKTIKFNIGTKGFLWWWKFS